MRGKPELGSARKPFGPENPGLSAFVLDDGIGPGPRVKDPAAAGQAMMTAAMAAMLIAML